MMHPYSKAPTGILIAVSTILLCVGRGWTDSDRGRVVLAGRLGPTTEIPQAGPPAGVGGRGAGGSAKAPTIVHYRLPGEFETQRVLLIGCGAMLSQVPKLFADLIAATRNEVAIVALVNHVRDFQLACQVLAERGISAAHVHFLEARHNTMWARDYGPMVVAGPEGRMALVDARYGLLERPDDDRVPVAVARRLQLPVLPASLQLEGGNLLSNGSGVCITTYPLLDMNRHQGLDEPTVRAEICRLYGAMQTVFLEPLAGEPTGHVDMFATFVSPNTVVVGAYDPNIDPENAAILDRNAGRLAELFTERGPMQVVRIAMPPHDDGVWRSYTNVVFANHSLLVPTYPGKDSMGRCKAITTFSRLLPHCKIVELAAEEVAASGGGLHCVTMNLGLIYSLPRSSVSRSDSVVGTGRRFLDSRSSFNIDCPFEGRREGRGESQKNVRFNFLPERPREYGNALSSSPTMAGVNLEDM